MKETVAFTCHTIVSLFQYPTRKLTLCAWSLEQQNYLIRISMCLLPLRNKNTELSWMITFENRSKPFAHTESFIWSTFHKNCSQTRQTLINHHWQFSPCQKVRCTCFRRNRGFLGTWRVSVSTVILAQNMNFHVMLQSVCCTLHILHTRLQPQVPQMFQHNSLNSIAKFKIFFSLLFQ